MTPQHAFLAGEYFSLALQGATQRANIYAPDVPESERKELHLHLRSLLEGLLLRYVQPVSSEDQCKTIESVARSLTRRHSGLLAGGRFRIGPAQKAVNLYLKYMWCAGAIARPPHCPIDAVVIKAAKLPASISWTRLDSIAEYAEVVRKLEQFAAPQPIAEWELREWLRGDA